MQKHDVIVSAVKLQIRRTTHKYGIEMPAPGKNVVQNAIDLDRRNGDTLWMDSLAKEMGNLMIAFKILEPGQKAPPSWHKATGHIIFDVKMDFTRKARWVKDGHKTPELTTSSFSGCASAPAGSRPSSSCSPPPPGSPAPAICGPVGNASRRGPR